MFADDDDDFDDTITAVVHPEVKWVTLLLLLLFMAFFMAMFGLLGRWRRITLFTMCKRLTGFRAPHLPTIIHYKVCKPKRLFYTSQSISYQGMDWSFAIQSLFGIQVK